MRSFWLNALLLRSITACEFCPNNIWIHGTWGPTSSRSNFYVGQGRTCNNVYIESLRDESTCAELIRKYRDPCCNPHSNITETVQNKITSQSGTKYPRGKNPTCHICTNRQIPSKRYTIITSNYLRGSFSCIQLYDYGRSGNIGVSGCYPLQVYVKDICGCHPLSQT